MNLFKKIFGSKDSVQKEIKTWQEVTQYFSSAIENTLGAKATIEWANTPAQTKVVSTFEDGFEYSTFMGNFTNEYESAPNKLEGMTEYWLDLIKNAQAQEEYEVLKNILPVIKSDEWLVASQQQIQQLNPDAEYIEKRVMRSLNTDLLVAYVIDTPTSMSYVQQDMLQKFGLDNEKALYTAALENLKKKALDAQVQGGGGRYAIRLDGVYDASLALLLEQFVSKMPDVHEPVFAIPERGELLVCCKTHEENTLGLTDLAKQIHAQASYQISTQIHQNNMGIWEDLGG